MQFRNSHSLPSKKCPPFRHSAEDKRLRDFYDFMGEVWEPIPRSGSKSSFTEDPEDGEELELTEDCQTKGGTELEETPEPFNDGYCTPQTESEEKEDEVLAMSLGGEPKRRKLDRPPSQPEPPLESTPPAEGKVADEAAEATESVDRELAEIEFPG